MVSIRKVGGIHFVKAGRLNVSFSLSRKPVSKPTHDRVERFVTRIEDLTCANWLNPVLSIGALLVFIAWTVALVQIPMDSWSTVAENLYLTRGFLH